MKNRAEDDQTFNKRKNNLEDVGLHLLTLKGMKSMFLLY
jgi:hypothetical protein